MGVPRAEQNLMGSGGLGGREMLPGMAPGPSPGVVPTQTFPLTSQAALDTKMPLVLGGGVG